MLDNGSVADLSYVPIYLDVAGQLKELIDDAADYEDDPLDEDDELDDGGEDDGPGRRARP